MKVIHTDQAPSHTGPVPQTVESGGWIYVSALFGADPQTGQIPDGMVTLTTALSSMNSVAITDCHCSPSFAVTA
jgi:enamine deaminase RidA (YjgF/YER057c/UK114 family)